MVANTSIHDAASGATEYPEQVVLVHFGHLVDYVTLESTVYSKQLYVVHIGHDVASEANICSDQ